VSRKASNVRKLRCVGPMNERAADTSNQGATDHPPSMMRCSRQQSGPSSVADAHSLPHMA
jgi:hypothetical protein